MTDKSAARRLCRSIRDGISPGERLELDRRILAALLNSEIYLTASSILTYVSVGSEPVTLDLITAAIRDGKTVAVPNCDSGEMLFYRINSLDSISPGKFGIPTVETDGKTPLDRFDGALCVVPALGLDRRGNRLGYGGGYYDRFLAANEVASLVLCRERCVFDSLPTDPHDIRIHLALTERGFIYFPKGGISE